MAEPMRQAPPECWLGLGGFGVLRGLCRGLWRCRLWRQFGFLFRGELLLDFEADRVHVHLVRGRCIAEKVADYTWHNNRHTFCSWLALAGVSIKEIQVLAGHKTITMAARYAHLSPEATASASERLVIAL